MTANVPQPYTTRPPTWDDLQGIADLIAACDVDAYGRADYTAEDLTADWQREEPTPPAWPDGVVLCPYLPGCDDRAVFEAAEPVPHGSTNAPGCTWNGSTPSGRSAARRDGVEHTAVVGRTRQRAATTTL